MQTFKSLAIVAVLGAIGVGLYLKINTMPEPQPPRDFAGAWGTPPMVELDGIPDGSAPMTLPAAGAPGGTAPIYEPQVSLPAAADTAPPFNPGDVALPPGASSPPQAPADAERDAAPAFNPFAGGMPAGSDDDGRYPRDDYPVAGHVNAGGGAINDPALRPAASSSPDHEPAAPPAAPTLFAPPRHESFDLAWDEARGLLERNALAEALLLLSSWHEHPTLAPAEQRELLNLLSQLAGTVIYSRGHHMEPPYVVRPGETLDDIAGLFHVPAGLLAKINSMSEPDRLHPGQELKVVRGPFAAMIDIDQRTMLLAVSGCYAGRFAIGLGSDQSEIEGDYVVSNKRQRPVYYGADRTIEGGHPDNPLGAHWIGLAKPLQNAAAGPFGIHGSNDPTAPPRDDPRGFVRLTPRDVVDAYDILSVGSRVVIRR